jgi:hypothetical protein
MATTVITNRYRPVVAPRLPSAPMEYNAQYQEQFMNILRLYFNQLDNLTGIVLGESGGRFIRFPYGAFSSDQDQTTTANTATLMTLNTTDFANQVSISSSKITVVNAGLYNLQFSVQFQNTDTAFQDVYIWLKQDGVDIPGSTGFVSIPNRHAGTDGHSIVGWNYFVEMQASDYVEIYWSVTNTAVSIQHLAASGTPTKPSTQSVVATLSFVSALST